MMKSFVLTLTLLLAVATNAFCVEPADTTDRNHPFVKHLEMLNLNYVNAAKEGDLETWLSLKVNNEADKLRNNPQVTPALLKQLSGQMPDYRKFDFKEVKVNGNAARVLYVNKQDGALKFSGDFFIKEGDDWKYKEGLEETFAGDLAKDPEGALKKFLSRPEMQFPQQ